MLPQTQVAVQLTGPDRLELNPAKLVSPPGERQVLLRTEAVGLCFSDMKLLKQFDAHVRKSDVLEGIEPAVLSELPSYVPGDRPTVPGHEVACRVVAVGPGVERYAVGDRLIVQADYRNLKTTGSNGAFGYNFEGGLQQFVIVDERVVGDPDDEAGYMIRVPDDRPASQLALVEPWACVENSYVTPERREVLAGGSTLIVGAEGDYNEKARRFASAAGTIAELDANHATGTPDEAFDDVLYFGSDAATIEKLGTKLAKGGVLCVVLNGGVIGRPVEVGVGRIHYGGTRWVGTMGDDPADGYAMIPPTGEIRVNDRILVVGAGGPMGQMHVIRDACAGVPGVRVLATDLDQHRLGVLRRKLETMGQTIDTATGAPDGETFTYVALMAPVPALVADAVRRAAPGAIVNIFAGIPAPVKHPLDLDEVIAKRVFMFGTSGSEPRDMRSVLDKVVTDRLDTNASVAAVSGMAGATDGLRAVDQRTMDGKIVVYPSLETTGLIPLEELKDRFPTVFEKLNEGRWTAEAEAEFLRVAN